MTYGSGIAPKTKAEFDLGTHLGIFEIEMQLWTDDTFTTEVPNEFVVHIPEMFYVGLSLPKNDDFILQGKKCWATARFEYIQSRSKLYEPILAKILMILLNTFFWITFVQLRQRIFLRYFRILSLQWYSLGFNHFHSLRS